MAAAAVVTSNGGAAAASNAPVPGRLASVYSEVQTSRLRHALPLPSVLRSHFAFADGPASSAAGNPDEIAKLFPYLFGQPSAALVPSAEPAATRPLKVGVVLSGGQAPGGHNVIYGIFDYLQEHAKGSTLYGFKGGPAGIMKCKYVELTADYVYHYRNQGGFDMICSGRDKIETLEQGHARRELRCGEADKKEIAGLKLQIEALNEKIRVCELKNKQHEELEKKYEHEKKRRQNLQKQLSESQKQLSELQLEFQSVCIKLARALK